MKKNPIIGIIGAIQAGVPLVKQVVSLFKKKPKTKDEVLNTMKPDELIDHIKGLESEEDKPFLIRLGNLVLTAATVYGVIWASKQMGVTYEDIINLFGLFK